MLKIKEHILILFIVVLLLPSVIQLFHSFESHIHNICSAVDEHHFHEQEQSCSQWHFQLEIFHYENLRKFTSIFVKPDLLPIENPSSIFTLDNNKKSSRAPPFTL
ncbi:hypothetical protein [Tenacibaculum sp. C7A-26P2]|uniref:hypothetical protein n=1 Tax=Tenacibaculum sp. C7A-26P2 TaxID=3447504 RepID=UPI003F878E49